MSNNLTHIQAKAVELFNLDVRRTSPKGWIIGGTCPWCGQNDKFGIKFTERKGEYRNHISFNCFRGSCKQKGSEWILFEKIGQRHLIQHGEFIGNRQEVENRIRQIEEAIQSTDVPTVSLPLGFRRVDSDPYLIERGFESWQFETYFIGRTTLYRPLKDYVLFSVREDGEHKGYVGRIVLDNEYIKQYKLDTGRVLPKYKNEGGIDFDKLVGGIDEVTENTNIVILVEGLTDKANVDRKLQLNLSEDIKCCATFGKVISERQIIKLWLKGVRNVILIYDPDAINESSRYSYQLEMWDINVKVGYLEDKDPGELSLQELQDVLSQLQTPDQFSIDKVQKRKLT